LAHQVPREKNYTSLVEQATGFDIVNGGRDAMGPAQWNIMVDRLAPKVQPDAVVMMMTRGDAFDLRDAKATIVKTGPGLGDVRIDQAKPEHDFVQEKFGPLLRQSALATFLARRGNLFINGITKGDGWLGYFLRHGHKAPPAKNETDGFPTQAIEVQLTQLMQVAEARGPVAFISIPSFVYHAHGQTELEPRSQVEAEIFPAAARRAGIPFVDLGPELRAIYAREQRPFSGFDNSQIGTGHLNTYGHSVVAKLIAAHLPDLLAQAQADHAHALGK
jgi:lysophospholipase L1-like esterase